MTTDQFNNLKEGDFFYHSSCAYTINIEFVVLENKNNIVRAKCTLAGGFYNEGEIKEFKEDIADNFKIGRNPHTKNLFGLSRMQPLDSTIIIDSTMPEGSQMITINTPMLLWNKHNMK